jgi:hypothetical protein
VAVRQHRVQPNGRHDDVGVDRRAPTGFGSRADNGDGLLSAVRARKDLRDFVGRPRFDARGQNRSARPARSAGWAR